MRASQEGSRELELPDVEYKTAFACANMHFFEERGQSFYQKILKGVFFALS